MVGNGTGGRNAGWTGIGFEQHSSNVHPNPEYVQAAAFYKDGGFAERQKISAVVKLARVTQVG